MKTKAVRMYGVKDLRLEEFDLPPIADGEILAHIISDSICMSSHKAALQGTAHKRVPKDIVEHPVIIGHEFCGEIVEVGKEWRGKFSPGRRFSIQPALNYKGSLAAPGYSYRYIGGDATYIVIPHEVMEMGCLLPYTGEAFFLGSLSEPMSCIVGAFHASYHLPIPGKYAHEMGIKQGGRMAILAGAGPMGMGAIDYAIHSDRKPALLIVTDIDDARLDRAAALLTVKDAAAHGVDLRYVNTASVPSAVDHLMSMTDGRGFDDVFVFAPVKPVVEMADRILAKDGCLNFFAGPTDPAFSASFNFYNVHYNGTHIVGTSGGNTEDMIESLEMMSAGKINPAAMITHIGGLNAVAETTLNLPNIPGGKKLIYTNMELELTAIDSFAEKGKTDPLFRKLARITAAAGGLWCLEAEEHLLANAKRI
jgi:threonine dehydrogenase-like Zn-dependent dehydrogenase